MKTELTPMTVATLKVVRKAEFGAFLDAGTGDSDDDILLHSAQQTSDVKVGDSVQVFLYLDPKKRLTASMRVPKMRVGQIARLKVINATKDGAFVDAGAERGIFMPFAEMRGRPEIGDVVWARLYVDKSGRLAASMKVSDEIRRAALPALNVAIGDKITGSVFEIDKAGAHIFSDARNIIYVARKDFNGALKVGESVAVDVLGIRADETIIGKILTGDAEKILSHIQKNGGVTDFNDKTAPAKILAAFGMSKAAFKRAVGHLLKDGRIEKIDGGFRAV